MNVRFGFYDPTNASNTISQSIWMHFNIKVKIYIRMRIGDAVLKSGIAQKAIETPSGVCAVEREILEVYLTLLSSKSFLHLECYTLY